mmetsp:Transcript_19648/g.36674  ORF Transcript_19648/g.36674 Transcript_19648/m.36674 type:complete len:93 (+) Transcript_19648:193-471(+)
MSPIMKSAGQIMCCQNLYVSRIWKWLGQQIKCNLMRCEGDTKRWINCHIALLININSMAFSDLAKRAIPCMLDEVQRANPRRQSTSQNLVFI